MNIQCHKCSIAKKRKHIVVGRGEMPADVLFLGEAPGKSEDTMGVPFIGPSGEMLNVMMEEAAVNVGFKKLPTFYLSNIVLCRPYVTDEKADDYLASREPNATEIFNCTPHILDIIAAVQPKVTIFVGKIAEENYAKELIDHVRIFHPTFLLKHGGKTSPYYMTDIRLIEKAFSMLGEEYAL